MAAGDKISCQTYANHLVNQGPIYDKEILKDVRPPQAELLGYYRAGTFDAFSGAQHTVDRFKGVQPNVTAAWSAVDGTDCTQKHCDLDANQIAWGYDRDTYGRERQSWKTQLICFEDVMLKTHAKEHFRQIIDDILRPATTQVMSFYLMRKAAELAGKKICVTTGLPDFTFTWDAGGNIYLNTTKDPTGRLTPQILEYYVRPLYANGAMKAGTKGYDNLQLHTDTDTFRYLSKDDPFLKSAWRFGSFQPSAKEFYEYGLSGFVGDFMVKCLQFPIRFNQISAGRYQVVLPYRNVATTEGIGSEFNPDYNRAQFQWSYINNPAALRIMPFKAEAVNEMMPFLIRDYGGKWRFATNDLGADCNGRPIPNYKVNKGIFYADFDLAVKPEHPEWLYLFMHKVDLPCITIIDTCNDLEYPYPAQDYSSDSDECPSIFTFEAVKKSGTYQVAVNSIRVDDNVIVNAAINVATLALLVAALPAISGGTWAIDNLTAQTIKLTGSTAESVIVPFLVL